MVNLQPSNILDLGTSSKHQNPIFIQRAGIWKICKAPAFAQLNRNCHWPILFPQMTKTIHRAKYLLQEPGILLKNAVLHVSSSGRITSVDVWNHRRFVPKSQVVDWGSAILIPGLINAHAHLELTSLGRKLSRFCSFSDWIVQLVKRRRTWTNEKYRASINEGVRMSLASGTTLIGDIRSRPIVPDEDSSIPLRQVLFHELIALAPAQAENVLTNLQAQLNHLPTDPLIKHGLSPHSPYTVSPLLYRRAAQLARIQKTVLATHVAETQAELQFLRNGTGEFREFLSTMGSLPADWLPPRLAPIQYLDSLNVLGPNCLLIHCNYLDYASMIKILKTRSHVVYCPRSHEFFGHENHPIRQLLDLGINVALGTDSLASNTSLSMIDEMRFLYQKRKDITAEEILKTATLNAAAALGYRGTLGRLNRGYQADITILEIPSYLSSRAIADEILEGAGECLATVIRGQIVWKKKDFHDIDAGFE